MGSESQQTAVPPSEQRGGTGLEQDEARAKGLAPDVGEGIVPPELGGSDAPRELLDDDPELGSSVLGETTGADTPATDDGISSAAGDAADATTDGGPDLPPESAPDQKDAPFASRQP